MQSDKHSTAPIDGPNAADSDGSFDEMPDFAEGMSFKFSIRKEASSQLSESVERNGDVHRQAALNNAANDSGSIAAITALKAIKRVYAKKTAAEAAAVETGGNEEVLAGAAKVSADEGGSILVIDEDGTFSRVIPGRSWLWGHYPDLANFLRAKKHIFFRDPDDQCATDLTIRLISFAGSKGYHFECLRDYEKLNDDLPTAVENMRGFKILLDRVSTYCLWLKVNESSDDDHASNSF